uniref:UBA domain-containing protein n=1 Tax=Arcella intermedia TaxID=1963864 RepID=A0A6B2LAT5_9EUKA
MIMLLCFVVSGLVHFTANMKNLLILDQRVFQDFSIWRLFTHHFVFQQAGEAFCGFLLLKIFCILEQRMGSRKFCSFLGLSMIQSTFYEILFLYVKKEGVTFYGPYSMIFPQLVQYYCEIPPLSDLAMNDKSIAYGLSFYLLASRVPASGYHAFFGLVSGIIYKMEFFKLDRVLVPDYLAEFCKNYILPLIEDPLSNSRHGTIALQNPQAIQSQLLQQRMIQEQLMQLQNQGLNPGINPALNPGLFHNQNLWNMFGPEPAMRQPPSEENITTLVNLGFQREHVIIELQRCNNDVELAGERLLQLQHR